MGNNLPPLKLLYIKKKKVNKIKPNLTPLQLLQVFWFYLPLTFLYIPTNHCLIILNYLL